MFNRMKRWSVGRRRMNRTVNAMASQSVRTVQGSFVTASSMGSRRMNRRDRQEPFLRGGIERRINNTLSRRQKCVTDIKSGWKFSALSLSRNERIDAASELVFEAYLLLNSEQGAEVSERLIRAAVRSFVLEVEKNYPNSNFHNFAHAVDVAQLMFTLINNYFKDRVRKPELFYLVIAALCHDLGHIGVTTPTLRKLNIIGEEETLEDFHIRKTLDLMHHSGLSLMSEKMLKPRFKQDLERYVRYLIDATDIGKCKIYLERAEKISQQTTSLSHLPLEYMAILMKVSDLANVTRDFDDSFSWGERLKIEMKAESDFMDDDINTIFEGITDTEKLEVTQHEVFVLQKRIKSNEFELHQGLAANTLKFVGFVVKPIFSVLPAIDERFAREYENRVRDNERRWRLTL